MKLYTHDQLISLLDQQKALCNIQANKGKDIMLSKYPQFPVATYEIGISVVKEVEQAQ